MAKLHSFWDYCNYIKLVGKIRGSNFISGSEMAKFLIVNDYPSSHGLVENGSKTVKYQYILKKIWDNFFGGVRVPYIYIYPGGV